MAVAGQGHNLMLSKEDRAHLAGLHAKVVQHKKEAADANAKANAARKEMRAMGIDLGAYAAVMARDAMDTDKRLIFDASMKNLSEALGIPIQGDLFVAGDDDDGQGDDGGDDDAPGDIPSGAFN